jgi:hypothetical protein
MVMLMTTHELRPLERKVLEVLQEAGGEWLTRGSIAKLLKRPGAIQPSDIAALEKLTMMGIVEARQTPRGAAALQWEYRTKQA